MNLWTQRRLRWPIVWMAAWVAFSSSPLWAIDDLFAWLHCRKAEPLSPSQGTVALRLHPLDVKQQPIPADGVSLSSLIVETDLVANALAHAQWNELRNSIPSAEVRGRVIQAEQPRAPNHIYADPKTPDTFVLGRGNRVVVFPRVLLLHPTVANIVVRDGDVVASLYLNPLAETRTDPLRKLLPNKELPDQALVGSSKITITLAGELMPDEVKGRRTIEQMPLSAYLEYVKFSGSNLETLVRTRMDGQLTGLLAVCVVTRRVNGMTVQYVSPLRDVGVFGVNGAMAKSLYSSSAIDAEEPKVHRNRWYRLFGDRLYSLQLIDGDQLEFRLFDSFWNSQGK